MLNNSPTAMGWIFLFVTAVAISLGWWWQQGQFVTVPSASSQSVPCLSYSPFRRAGADPAKLDSVVSKEQITEDLKLLKPLSQCIRTYGVSKGLEHVPAAAQALNMRVRLGLWLSKDAIANEQELATALALTKKYRSSIDMLIVGNEVLLREDLKPNELATFLQRAKKDAAVPVTYADVWEFWRRHPTLAQYVDLITIHVLPYWEDEPVAAAQAVDHVFNTFYDMKRDFPNMPMWIGETGWPSLGRQREGALPSSYGQSAIIRGAIDRAAREKIDINIIEAFDQPWKRFLEGGMGAAWGMFDANGQQRIALSGPTQEDSRYWRGLVGASLGALVGWLAGALFGRLNITILASAGALIGVTMPAHIDWLMLWNRDAREWIIYASRSVLVFATTCALLWRVCRRTAGFDALKKATDILVILTLAVTCFWAWEFWVDPRYRGFPMALYWPLAILSVGTLFSKPSSPNSKWVEIPTCLLAILLLILALAMLLQETFLNTQAIITWLLWSLFAIQSIKQNSR
jgi:exo-beta-1,3-glucanase (GH17 family)